MLNYMNLRVLTQPIDSNGSIITQPFILLDFSQILNVEDCAYDFQNCWPGALPLKTHPVTLEVSAKVFKLELKV